MTQDGSNTMKVGIAQITATTDKTTNLARIEEAIHQAAAAGARLLLTPELVMYDPDAPDPSFVPIAEPLDGPFVTRVAAMARSAGIAVVVGVYETIPGEDRVRNTEVALGPDGDVLAVYRKIHLFDALGFRESGRIAPADVAANIGTVFDLDGWRFGLVTCFDLRFPELVRTLADAGAEVILHPTAWTSGPVKEEQHALFCRARAVENTCYVISANQSPPSFTGRSLAVDPMGVVRAGLDEDDGVVVTTLSRERLNAVRAKLPLLELRRVGTQVPATGDSGSTS